MIGVFDSGLGGLTILRSFLEKCPDFDYLYLADQDRAPYGDLSEAAILEYTRQGVEFLFGKGAKLVVLACNTASAVALRTLQSEGFGEGRNVLGVVVSVAEALEEGGYERVGLIGTEALVKSGMYEEMVGAMDLEQVACPRLVPLIEAGQALGEEAREALADYLAQLGQVDVLVPACTHYPLLEPVLSELAAPVPVLPVGDIEAEKLMDYVARHPEYEPGNGAVRRFYATGDCAAFERVARQYFGDMISEVECATLGA